MTTSLSMLLGDGPVLGREGVLEGEGVVNEIRVGSTSARVVVKSARVRRPDARFARHEGRFPSPETHLEPRRSQEALHEAAFDLHEGDVVPLHRSFARDEPTFERLEPAPPPDEGRSLSAETVLSRHEGEKSALEATFRPAARSIGAPGVTVVLVLTTFVPNESTLVRMFPRQVAIQPTFRRIFSSFVRSLPSLMRVKPKFAANKPSFLPTLLSFVPAHPLLPLNQTFFVLARPRFVSASSSFVPTKVGVPRIKPSFMQANSWSMPT